MSGQPHLASASAILSYGRDGARSISNVEATCRRIEPDVVGVVAEWDAADHSKRSSVEKHEIATAAVSHGDDVAGKRLSDALGFMEAGERAQHRASARVQDFDGVVTERSDEQP